MEGNLNLNICKNRNQILQEQSKVRDLNKQISEDMAKKKLSSAELQMIYKEMYDVWMHTRITHKELAKRYGYSEAYCRQIIHRMRKVFG